jgi:thiol-disulfide isomerase/thioredoxin
VSAPDDLDALLDSEEEGSRAGGLLRYLRDWGVAIGLAVALYLGVGYLRAPELPAEAPGFSLVNLEGQRVDLASLRGQTVVLNFWATWCGPCRMEIPTFSAFAEEHPEIPVLGIATDGDAASLKAAREALGIRYPVLIADAATTDAYQINTIPTTVVVGPDGAVEAVHVGIMTRPQLWWATR